MALSISNTALKKIKCCFSKTVNPYTLVFQKHSVFEKQLIQTTLSVFQKMNSAVFEKQSQKQLIQTEPGIFLCLQSQNSMKMLIKKSQYLNPQSILLVLKPL